MSLDDNEIPSITAVRTFVKVNVGGVIFLLNEDIVEASGYFKAMIKLKHFCVKSLTLIPNKRIISDSFTDSSLSLSNPLTSTQITTIPTTKSSTLCKSSESSGSSGSSESSDSNESSESKLSTTLIQTTTTKNDKIVDYSSCIIDRNPQSFAYIVDCFRDISYENSDKLRAIKPELEYFQFEGALKRLSAAGDTDTEGKVEEKILVEEIEYVHAPKFRLESISSIVEPATLYGQNSVQIRSRQILKMSPGTHGIQLSNIYIVVPNGWIVLLEFYTPQLHFYQRCLEPGVYIRPSFMCSESKFLSYMATGDPIMSFIGIKVPRLLVSKFLVDLFLYIVLKSRVGFYSFAKLVQDR
jgi:hypothetical protein